MPLLHGDARKDCCKQEANLGPVQRVDEKRADLTFRRCQVCRCRHFEMQVDPLRLNLKGATL